MKFEVKNRFMRDWQCGGVTAKSLRALSFALSEGKP